MKGKISAFIHNLITYDYMLFGGVLLLFILLILLGLLLRKKLGFALFFISLAFVTLFIGPIVGYTQLHNYLFKNSIQLISQKKLHFSEAVIVRGRLSNESRRRFQSCTITLHAYGVTSSRLKNYLKELKPFKKMSIIEEDIAVAESREFKIIVEPFRYSREYNISLGAACR